MPNATGWMPNGARGPPHEEADPVTPRVPGRPALVLHVFGVMDRAGAEMRTLEVMRATHGEIVHEFATLEQRAGTLDAEILRLGGQVHSCPLDVTFPLRFAALCRRRRPDVVHSHVYLASGVVLGAAAAAGVPRRVAHFRTAVGSTDLTLRRRAYEATMRLLIHRFATAVIGVCEGALDCLWGSNWTEDPRYGVVYDGVDARPFREPGDRDLIRAELGIPAAARLILHVGRFAPVKNQPLAVDIIAELAQRQQVHLVFVGRHEGTADEVLSRVDAHGLRGAVHLLGERDDVPRLMHAADALLLTSRHEGLPGVVLEALASGLPVVASDLPGVREISARLPNVAPVPRDALPSVWAAAVAAAVERPFTESERAEARARFTASPFVLEASVANLRRLWLQ